MLEKDKSLIIDSAIVGAIAGAAIANYRQYNIPKTILIGAILFSSITYFLTQNKSKIK